MVERECICVCERERDEADETKIRASNTVVGMTNVGVGFGHPAGMKQPSQPTYVVDACSAENGAGETAVTGRDRDAKGEAVKAVAEASVRRAAAIFMVRQPEQREKVSGRSSLVVRAFSSSEETHAEADVQRSGYTWFIYFIISRLLYCTVLLLIGFRVLYLLSRFRASNNAMLGTVSKRQRECIPCCRGKELTLTLLVLQ